ncbi:MAG: hypothetical protein QNJ32_04305 [Xenococcaceae cyanobacterium MO_167.B27]|nr:hypothetical protein [Xenococcaceae cyanobacterium MO_167.B27]
MLQDFFPFLFPINQTAIAGSCLWSLVFYISLTSVKDWITEQLSRWFNFAERSLYTIEEYEETRPVRESQNAFYASVMSIIPFLILGAVCNWGISFSLGISWSISLGIMTCIISGVYALGRQD